MYHQESESIKKKTIMTNSVSETTAQLAIDMALLDAIERGAEIASDLVIYMETPAFLNSVKNYMALIEEMKISLKA